MKRYLWTNRILLTDFGSHVERVSRRLKEASLAEAQAAGRPVKYLASSRVSKEGRGLTTKEQEGVVRGAVRSVIYDSSFRKVKIDWIKPPDGSARDERPALSGGNIQRRDLE